MDLWAMRGHCVICGRGLRLAGRPEVFLPYPHLPSGVKRFLAASSQKPLTALQWVCKKHCMPSLTVDAHPQRDLIIKLRAAGKPLSEISSSIQPYVSRNSLGRFFQRIAIAASMKQSLSATSLIEHKEVSAVELASALSSVDPLRARLEKRYADIDAGIATIGDYDIKSHPGATLAQLVSADAKLMDLQAKIEGRYDQATTKIAISISMGPQQPGPRPAAQIPDAVQFIDDPSTDS